MFKLNIYTIITLNFILFLRVYKCYGNLTDDLKFVKDTEAKLKISTTSNFIKLPLDTEAACLDGSNYGFYYVKSKTNSTKWTISIEGGGWCYNETLCEGRAKTRLGSSKSWAANAGTLLLIYYFINLLSIKKLIPWITDFSPDSKVIFFFYSRLRLHERIG